jgi:hypothetical protein
MENKDMQQFIKDLKITKDVVHLIKLRSNILIEKLLQLSCKIIFLHII